jgi:hypothetical protein
MYRVSSRPLVEQAFGSLRLLLGKASGLQLRSCFDSIAPGHDVWWEIVSGPDACRLLVEAHEEFTPRTLSGLGYLTSATIRQMGDPTVLVVAPWLSLRCRQLIDERRWSYLDLTGNVHLRAYQPAVYMRLDGVAHRDGPADLLLRGARVNALVRVLVDATPPYRVRDLAAATGLSESYVSRATRTLHEEGLVDRPGTAPVTEVDWAELLRQRGRAYNVLTDNVSRGFVTPGDPRDLVRRLRDADAVVTGLFATEEEQANQLALYVPNLRSFAAAHGLRPSRTDANVRLLEPASRSQIERCRVVSGVRMTGYSQLVQDLLSGDAVTQGEDLLRRMTATAEWRLPRLPNPNNPGDSSRPTVPLAANAS